MLEMLIKGLSVSSSKAFSEGLCSSGNLCLTCKFFHLNEGVFCGSSLQKLLCKPATTSLQKPGDIEKKRSRVMQLTRCKNPLRNLMSCCQTKHPTTNHFVLPFSTSLCSPQPGTISLSDNPFHTKSPRSQHSAFSLCSVLIPHPNHMPVLQLPLWHLSRDI